MGSVSIDSTFNEIQDVVNVSSNSYGGTEKKLKSLEEKKVIRDDRVDAMALNAGRAMRGMSTGIGIDLTSDYTDSYAKLTEGYTFRDDKAYLNGKRLVSRIDNGEESGFVGWLKSVWNWQPRKD